MKKNSLYIYSNNSINNTDKKFDLVKGLNSNLNVFKQDKNKNSVGVVYNDHNTLYPAVSKTWKDNIYSFNKNLSKHVPVYSLNVNSILAYYFNMYNINIEKKIFKGRKRHINRFRRISVNKILISKLESSFTNNKVLVNIFAFNSEKYYLMKHFYNLKARLNNWNKRKINFSKLKLIKQKNNLNRKINLFKNLVTNSLYDKNKTLSNKSMFRYINIMLRKYIHTMLYKYLLFLNKSKFNNVFLSKLTPLLEKVYNKKVNINIINLKHFHMNNEITSKLLTMKLRKRQISLVRLLKGLKNYLNKQLLPFIDKVKKTNKIRHLVLVNSNKSTIILKPHSSVSLNKNYFSQMLTDIFSVKRKGFLRNVDYKYVGGIMMKIGGRLTKRFTAARSVKSTFNKGIIKNVYSQRKVMSSKLTKGYLMPNVQYTNINYKTRVGAFGIKGWLGSV